MAAESNLESSLREWCISQGIYTRKFVSPGHRGVPDRILIKKSRVLFLELKAPKETPTPLQEREMRILNSHGIPAFWAGSLQGAKDLIHDHLLTPSDG